jgi:hypothetical protein
MKADVQYNDFIGSSAADISDYLGTKYNDDIESFGKFFKIDEERFKVIGISIYGVQDPYISLYCIDKNRTTEFKEHIVKISVHIEEEDQKDILEILFKRLHIVLHSRFDEKFPNLDYDEEARYSDFHDTQEE